jgi:GrpB-like predicted nucleotidyltransferase (UPF0157 family)
VINKSSSQEPPKESHFTPEEYIEEVTVGERKPRNSKIHLEPYNPRWPADFQILAERVRQALGEKALLVEHVGSTSVKGLSAKPILDMLLVVEDSSDEKAYVSALEKHGFSLRIREPDWFEHRLLKGIEIRANLHVFSEGCQEIERMLLFRDRLRSNEADRALYEQRKKELAARTWRYTQHYADAKSAVVEEILTRAQN